MTSPLPGSEGVIRPASSAASVPQSGFEPLILALQDLAVAVGLPASDHKVLKTVVALKFGVKATSIYSACGVPNFKEYVKLAIKNGVIVQYDSNTIGLA